jgi:hypothetical protein
MDGYQRGLLLLVAAAMLGLSGASCPQLVQQFQPRPRVLSASPTLEEVIQVVNRNNSQIQSLSTTQATLSVPGTPTLRANLMFQRPRRLRLRADLLTLPELDLGSNEELFWFWVKRNPPPAIYWCRHDQFAYSRARQMIPLEPDWLIEAMGISEFDPALPYQGPFPLPGDRLEIRTIRETPQGPTTKVTVVDASQGWILEQRLHDSEGRLLASAQTSFHRRDPLTGLVVPTLVVINCPPAQFSARIDLGNVQINRLSGDPMQLWTIPNYPGYPLVDLCDPRIPFPPPVAAGPAAPAYPQGAMAPMRRP